MKFTTLVPIPNSIHPLDYDSLILTLGSCFAVNMGERLNYFKFQNTTNPFGIIFNPVSIEKLIVRAVNQKQFTEEDIFFHNERFHCYEVHSDLSSVNRQELLHNLNTSLEFTYQKIKVASHILITYGTAWVYQEKNSGVVVANCHKMTQSHFDKHLLSVASIEAAIQNTVDAIRKVNPNCSFVFTLSPVRHIKDGFVENQRSKAHLITALQNLLSDHMLDKANYFPAYEIVMDELRDYRFYGEDLVHPSSMAIEYIWQRFRASSISETAMSTLDEVEAIQKSLLHKPFNPLAESHQKFQSKLQEKISRLQEKHPFIKF
jgi:hypothetical protein